MIEVQLIFLQTDLYLRRAHYQYSALNLKRDNASNCGHGTRQELGVILRFVRD